MTNATPSWRIALEIITLSLSDQMLVLSNSFRDLTSHEY